MISNSRVCLGAALMLSWGIATAQAADVPDDPTPAPQPIPAEEWEVSLAPYFWATFYEGDITINGLKVDMSGISVFDLLNDGDLRFVPIVGYFEARKGRWGGYFDITYIGLEFSSGDISVGPGIVTAGMDFTYALAHAGLVYTAAEWEQPGSTTAFDVLVGGRFTHYDVDLTITAGGPIGYSGSEKMNFWDITLGARFRGHHDNGWFYNLRGDIAGAGLESDLSLHGLANFGRDFQLGRVNMSWVLGYRVLYQDWSSGNDAVDLTTHGPMAGLSFNW